MRHIKRNLFGVYKPAIVPVIETEQGTVYFAKMPITVDVHPEDVQAGLNKQDELSSLIYDAAIALAKEHNVSTEQAREMLFAQEDSKVNFLDQLSDTQRQSAEALLDVAVQNFAAEKGVLVEKAKALIYPQAQTQTAVNFFDYLAPEQRRQVISLQREAADLPLKCATAFMQKRLAFNVELLADAAAGEGELAIAEPWFDLQIGDRLEFNRSTIVTVKAPFSEGKIGIHPLPIDLQASATGFRLLPSGEYHLGEPEFTEDDTKAMLSIGDGGQIATLYAFYQSCFELNQSKKPTAGKEGNALPEEKSLTGTTSTSNGATSDSERNGLESKLLVASPST